MFKQQTITMFNKLIIFLIVLNLVNLTSQRSEQNQQQQYQSLNDMIFTAQAHQKSYDSLISKYKNLKIESNIIRRKKLTQIQLKKGKKQVKAKQNDDKSKQMIQQTIASTSKHVTLQEDFFSMYRKYRQFQLSFAINENIFTDSNNYYIQNKLYVEIEEHLYLYETQTIPLFRSSHKLQKQGLQLVFMADTFLFNNNEQTSILSKFDMYFFNIDQQLIFNKTISGNKNNQNPFFGIFLNDVNPKINTYYVKSFCNTLNQFLQQHHVKAKDLKIGQQFSIKFQVKLVGDMLPLFLYGAQRVYSLNQFDYALNLNDYINVYQSLSTLQVDSIKITLIRLLKNIIFEGSLLKHAFLIIEIILICFLPLSSWLVYYYLIQMFKTVSLNKGVSKYALMMALIIQSVDVLFTGLQLIQGDTIQMSQLILLFGIIWMIFKFGSFQLTNDFPYIVQNEQPWYVQYKIQDLIAFRKVINFILLFTFVVMVYPFAIQAAFYKVIDQQGLLIYMMGRIWDFSIDYSLVLTLLPQILLNYKLKSCSAISGKLLFWLIPFHSINNLQILTIKNQYWLNSIIQLIYYFKNEIVITILIIQKIIYK